MEKYHRFLIEWGLLATIFIGSICARRFVLFVYRFARKTA